MEEYTLQRKTMKALLSALFVGVVLYAFIKQNMVLGAVMIVFPFAVFFLMRPSVAAMGVFFFSFSTLTLPFLPASLTLNYLLQFIMIGWLLSASAMRILPRIRPGLTEWMAGLYILVILLTMSVRGFGLRLMGGMEYGGTGYVYLLLWLGFFFACRHITLSEKQIRRLLPALWVSALIPLLLMLLVYIKPSLLSKVIRFSVASFDYLEGAIRSGEMGKGRWGSGTILAIFTLCYALAAPFKKWAGPKRVVLVAGALLFSLISGFRSNFFELIVMLSLWTVLRGKNKVMTFLGIGTVGLMAWGSAILLVDYLPANMQRTLSILPGVHVYGETAQGAQVSLDWRFEVWRYAVTKVPEFALIGRGLVTDVADVAYLQRSFYVSPDFAWVIGNYHSGPLSILLTFGIPGAIAFFGFWLGGFRKGLIALRRHRSQRNHYAYRYLQWSTMMVGLQMFWFVFLNGSPLASLPQMTLWVVATSWFEKNLAAQSGGPREAPDSSELPRFAAGA